MIFGQINGLEQTKEVLLQAVKRNHVSHAQLFLGNEGTANLAMALAYTTYIFCENKGEHDACGQCASCHKMKSFAHPDLHFVFPTNIVGKKKALSKNYLQEWRTFLQHPYGSISDWLTMIGAESKQPAISAEEGRGILSTLALKPFEAEYKVLLMWLPEYMNTVSANAILKILEEPPQKTLFLLVSHSIERMLVTILSRVQILKVPDFSDVDIKKYLIDLHQVDEKRASQVAILADGNLPKALKLLDGMQDDNETAFRDWMRLCYSSNYTELVKMMDDFSSKSRDAQRNLLQFGLNICRDALVYQMAGQEIVRLEGESLKFVQGLSKVITPRNVEQIYQYLNEAFFHLLRNASPKIVFLDTSLKIAKVIRL